VPFYFSLPWCRYGEERYEKKDMQIRVRERFGELMKEDSNSDRWHVVNAAQSMEEVQKEINTIVESTIQRVQSEPLGKLWAPAGEYFTIEEKEEDKENS
jgi:dTMP kinase